MSMEQSPPLPIGEVVAQGRFRIASVLGRGAFGITYEAVRTRDGKRFAIKEYLPFKTCRRMNKGIVRPLPGKEAEFEKGKEVFYEEAHILRSLPRQRGLVKVIGASERKGTYLCMMEFIEGKTIKELVPMLVQQHSHVPEEIIRQFVYLLSAALHSVHTKARLTHRDIKPDNIMIRKSNREPVLIDFGAARPLDRHVDIPDMYTPPYAAIEQFSVRKTGYNQDAKIGPWTDLFGLSLVLYEMMSQSLPLPSHQRWAALKETGKDPYVPIRENLARNRIKATYSDDLLDLIDRGCRLLPHQRPRTAKEFAKALGRPRETAEAGAQHQKEETRIIAIWTEGEADDNPVVSRLLRIWERGKLFWIILILAGAVTIFSYLYGAGVFE